MTDLHELSDVLDKLGFKLEDWQIEWLLQLYQGEEYDTRT